MTHQVAHPDQRRRRTQPYLRLLLVAMALMAAVSCGCTQLRLPAIDPTGQCLFAPKPTTTTLALPGSAGEGCLATDCFRNVTGTIGDCFRRPFVMPEPAFTEPPAIPACPQPTAPAVGGPIPGGTAPGVPAEPCVPGPACNGSCKTGPRAVLIGDEMYRRPKHQLPDRGKRGCILLTPTRIVAPVGGEVVLLSGICGTDGYLMMNEKLEWMLTPDSVGTFIEVGDDHPGIVHRLAGAKERPKKLDPSYAIGITSTKPALITRGNLNARDDVRLEKGQTWLTISSPSEGTSHVTVLASESECWDQRKATATIYWVDANAQFPSPQIVPAGQPVELTTRVTRSQGGLPAQGWKVRYEILQPELASFAGTNGSPVVEAVVDESGNATVQLVPLSNTSGTATINMQVIRPGGVTDSMPTLTLATGQTFVTWSAPQLDLRAGAPQIATFDDPFQVVANLSNPGDQAAENVRVEVQIPPGARVTGADSFAQVLPNAVIWEIGTLPPQTQLDLFMNVASQSTIDLVFQARGDGLIAEDTVRVDVFRPSLRISAQPVQERVEAGQPVTFNIDVTNVGDRPLQNLTLTATGNRDIVHESGEPLLTNVREEGALQPGETWAAEIVFIPTTAGRRCVTFEATADGGQRDSTEGCVTAINPIPQTPSLQATLEARERVATNQTALVRARVGNLGEGPATNVVVNLAFDPQLQLLQATDGADQSRLGQNIVSWTVPRIDPDNEAVLEVQFQPLSADPQSLVRLGAESDEGANASAELSIEILDAPVPPDEITPPPLPPAQPSPEIPGGRAPEPLRGAPPANDSGAAQPIPSARSGQLTVQLFGRDNPVGVSQPIRYSLRVVNDSEQVDGQVEVQFRLPDGVTVDRVAPLRNPELAGFEVNAGIVSLPYIRRMNPGESVEYEIVLRSNQPQTFELPVRVRSQRAPAGVQTSVSTTVTQ